MRISIIGVGRVGSAIAYTLIARDSFKGELALLDINTPKLRGEYKDLLNASRLFVSHVRPVIAQDTFNSEVVIISAGKARFASKDSMETLLKENKPIIENIAYVLAEVSPHAVVFLVTNPPEDLLSMFEAERSVFPIERRLEEARRLDGIKGDEILDLKGFTNWGIASEVAVRVEEYIKWRGYELRRS